MLQRLGLCRRIASEHAASSGSPERVQFVSDPPLPTAPLPSVNHLDQVPVLPPFDSFKQVNDATCALMRLQASQQAGWTMATPLLLAVLIRSGVPSLAQVPHGLWLRDNLVLLQVRCTPSP